MIQRSRDAFARVGAVAAILAIAASFVTAPAVGAASSQLFVAKGAQASDANPCSASRPCLTIEHAVALAPAGATIHVGRGTYAEQVSITKRLSLQGEHAVIDATGQTGGIEPLASMGIVGYGMLVFGPAASGSVIKGFTVQHALGEGILVAGTSKVRIEGNRLRLDDAGFGTDATFECMAQGDIPGDCGEALHFVSVTWSSMSHNLVEDNVGGILVTDEFGPSAHNVIAFNVSRDNKEDCGITLPSHNAAALGDPTMGGVYDNLIFGNLSEGNGGAGVGMFAPFPGAASYDNLVLDNTLRDNGEAGVGIHAHAPGQNVSGNAIVGNQISGNGIDPDSGSGHPTGIAIFSAVVPVTATVAMNHVANEYWGVFRNGPITITGLSSNHFAKSVTVHIN